MLKTLFTAVAVAALSASPLLACEFMKGDKAESKAKSEFKAEGTSKAKKERSAKAAKKAEEAAPLAEGKAADTKI